MTFSIVYRKSHTTEAARNTIKNLCAKLSVEILIEESVKRICSCIIQAAVCQLPKHLLKDGRFFTIEILCYESKAEGLVNFALRDFYNACAEVACSDNQNLCRKLRELLGQSMIQECEKYLGLTVLEFYPALLLAYCKLTHNSVMENKVQGLMVRTDPVCLSDYQVLMEGI